MKKGALNPVIAVFFLVSAVIGFVVLDAVTFSVIGPGDTSELLNLTGYQYKTLASLPATSIRVFNDTNCEVDELFAGTDFTADTPYDGTITGASITTGLNGTDALEFNNSDIVVMTSSSGENINGDLTIVGWVKPTGI